MIPAGYMAKRVLKRTEWPKNEQVEDIYSVSSCMSRAFAEDYVNLWEHNGYWLYNSPAVIQELARKHGIDLSGCTWFYYELYELEYDADRRLWRRFAPAPSFPTDVEPSADRELQGFDVVSFSMGTDPECSPLSCNGLAEKIPVNRHCLLDGFETAKELLQTGAFHHGEPGPYRIFGVYTVARRKRGATEP